MIRTRLSVHVANLVVKNCSIVSRANLINDNSQYYVRTLMISQWHLDCHYMLVQCDCLKTSEIIGKKAVIITWAISLHNVVHTMCICSFHTDVIPVFSEACPNTSVKWDGEVLAHYTGYKWDHNLLQHALWNEAGSGGWHFGQGALSLFLCK